MNLRVCSCTLTILLLAGTLWAAETETVAWLVRHHLVMSETAQMRDLNDFKTVLDFASLVQMARRFGRCKGTGVKTVALLAIRFSSN